MIGCHLPPTLSNHDRKILQNLRGFQKRNLKKNLKTILPLVAKTSKSKRLWVVH